jgi:uncharacterized membrane protein
MISDAFLRRAALVFSIIGLLVSIYLVFIKFFPTSTLCVGAGGCDVVNTSVYSEIAGIPIAALGALAYAFVLALLLLESKNSFVEQWGPLVIFGVALAGTIYSAYLTYIELEVLHAVCPYCVTSAVAMLLLFAAATVRLRKYV